MAENQYSRRHASRIEDIPQDDPLAELARIIEFETDRRSSVAEEVTQPGRELEDELLREFDTFDVSMRYGTPANSTTEPAQAGGLALRDRPSEPEDEGHALEDELLRDIEGRSALPVAHEAEQDEWTPAGERDAEARHRSDAWPEPTAERASIAEPVAIEPGYDDLSIDELDPEYGAAEDESAAEESWQMRAAEEPRPVDHDFRGAALGDAPSAGVEEAGEPDFDFGFEEEVYRQGEPAAEAEEAAPFISADRYEPDQAEADDDAPALDAAALEEDIAAELRLPDDDFEVEAATDAFDDEHSAGQHLFEPAPAFWDETDAAAEPEPYAEARAETGLPLEADPSPVLPGGHAMQPPVRGVPHAAQTTSEEILADLGRFDISAYGDRDAGAGRKEAVTASGAGRATGEASTNELDDWLREMGLDQPVSGRAGVPVTNEAQWREAGNVVPLHQDVRSAEHDDDTPAEAVEEPFSNEMRFEDHEALNAALEADLANVFDDFEHEPETSDPAASDFDDRPAARDEAFWHADPAPQAADFHDLAPAAEDDPEAIEEQVEAPILPERYDDEQVQADRAGYEAFDFDPALINEPDEAVEPVGELEVPRVPVEDEPVAAAAADDAFDLDLDSDFGDLLASAPVTEEPAPRAASSVSTVAAAASVAGSAAIARDRFDITATPVSEFRSPIVEGEDSPGFGEDFDTDLSTPPAGGRETPPPSSYNRAGVLPTLGRRNAMLASGVAVLVLVVGAGAWMLHGSGSGTSGSDGPRVISADSKPVKQKPANPGGTKVPNQNKIVYDSVDGTISQTPQQKNLVTTAEQPSDVVQRTIDPDMLPLNNPERQKADAAAGGARNGNGDAGTKGQDRLPSDAAKSKGSPADVAPRSLQPQVVETMVVTADGKLVPRGGTTTGEPDDTADTAPAAPAMAPAAPSNTPSATAPVTSSALSPPSQAPAARTAQPTPRPAAEPQPAPVAKATPPAAKAPAPAPAQPSTPAAQPAAPAAQQTAAAEAPANPGGYLIQIAAQPTEAGAKASYQNMAKRYGSVIGGHGVDIKRVEIAGKGVYYRVRIPAGSRQQAISMCESYKSAGGSCFVTR